MPMYRRLLNKVPKSLLEVRLPSDGVSGKEATETFWQWHESMEAARLAPCLTQVNDPNSALRPHAGAQNGKIAIQKARFRTSPKRLCQEEIE